jgi:hypothetical protein
MCELISPPIKFLIGKSVVLKYNGGPVWKFISRKSQDLTNIHKEPLNSNHPTCSPGPCQGQGLKGSGISTNNQLSNPKKTKSSSLDFGDWEWELRRK